MITTDAVRASACRARIASQQLSCGLNHQDRAGERRPETVVQVAAEPPALLFAGGDEPLPRTLDFAGERNSAYGCCSVPDEVLEQPTVGLAERFAVGAG